MEASVTERNQAARGSRTYSENIRIGLDALLAQKTRSLLTMLGIIFGVAAVVAMQSIGAGARQEVMEAIRVLGVNNIIIKSLELEDKELEKAVETNPKRLHPKDAQALRKILPNVRYVVPVKRLDATIRVPQEVKISVVGTSPQYQEMLTLPISEGRFLTASDENGKMPVAVISQPLKRRLFPIERASGKKIKVGKTWFTIVGVVDPPGAAGVRGVEVRDMSLDLYCPLSTLKNKFGIDRSTSPLDEIKLQVTDESYVPTTSIAAERIMKRRHRDAGDYEIVVPVELLKQSQQTQRIFNIVMGAIASISLLVGGIGIMNIMLSNVLERTREIGVRRAVGAKQSDVVSQFLIEAVLLSVVGGLIGILIGILMAWSITVYAGWATEVGILAVIVAFGVSAGVGVLFGWWPAKKAAEMNVINALRYE